MTPTTTINGALARLNNGKLEYQCRVGKMLKWQVWFRELDGAHFEFVWAPTREDAYTEALGLHVMLLNDPIHPEYDQGSIAAGWSPEEAERAKTWAIVQEGDVMATKRIAQLFAHKAAAE